MRERIRDKERLVHILTAIDNLTEGRKRYTVEEAEKDVIIFIGEATYKLTKEFRESHPEVEWEVIENMRHVLVHGYFAITPHKVWRVIDNDLPVLRPQIERFIQEEESVE